MPDEWTPPHEQATAVQAAPTTEAEPDEWTPPHEQATAVQAAPTTEAEPVEWTPPHEQATAVQAAPTTERERSARPVRAGTLRPNTPALRTQAMAPLQTRAIPGSMTPATAQLPVTQQARVGLSAPPDVTATASKAPSDPPPDEVAAPLRIIAAVVGVALLAIPLITGALKYTPPPRPSRPVATFHVGDRDVGTYWPAPASPPTANSLSHPAS